QRRQFRQAAGAGGHRRRLRGQVDLGRGRRGGGGGRHPGQRRLRAGWRGRGGNLGVAVHGVVEDRLVRAHLALPVQQRQRGGGVQGGSLPDWVGGHGRKARRR